MGSYSVPTLVALVVVILSGKGVLAEEDYGNFYPDYDDYQENTEKDGNVSAAVVRSIVEEILSGEIDQFKETAASYTLNHPEMKSIVVKHYNEARKKERDCKAENDSYWDPEIPDCRSCLWDMCDQDETCRGECRDVLKIKSLEEEAVEAKKKNESLNEQLNTLNIWVIILTVVVSCAILAGLAVSIVAFKLIKNVRETKPKMAESDKELVKMPTEEQGFLNDSGNVSEATAA